MEIDAEVKTAPKVKAPEEVETDFEMFKYMYKKRGRFLICPGIFQILLILAISLPYIPDSATKWYIGISFSVLIWMVSAIIATLEKMSETYTIAIKDYMQAKEDYLKATKIKDLIDKFTATCTAINETQNNIKSLQNDVKTLPNIIKLSSLLSALKEVTKEGELHKLCDSGLCERIAISKIKSISKEIAGIGNLRLVFQSSYSFFTTLESEWASFKDSLDFKKRVYLLLEWIPSEGLIKSNKYASIYKDTIIKDITNEVCMEKRIYSTNQEPSALEYYFLEDESIKNNLKNIRIRTYSDTGDIAYEERGIGSNILLICNQNAGGSLEPKILLKFTQEHQSEKFEGTLSVNETDLDKALNIFQEGYKRYFFDDCEIDKDELKRKIIDTPQGQVFNSIEKGFQSAKNAVWATDISGAIPGNGIELWTRSSFYRSINRITNLVAKRLYDNHGKLDDNHGFTRIYIFSFKYDEDRENALVHLKKACQNEYIRNLAIEIEKLPEYLNFPNEDNHIMDFHIIDSKQVTKLDIDPKNPYSSSVLFKLDKIERHGLQKCLNKPEDKRTKAESALLEDYFLNFFDSNVEGYINCFSELVKIAIPIKTENDVKNFIGY